MTSIDTIVKVSTKFLDEPAGPAEKAIWKRTYAIYLTSTGKSPKEAANERPKLTTLLPILKSL